MRKAHPFEALHLLNQGVDEAVSGLEWLKRTADFKEAFYGDVFARMESRRARLNLQLFDDMQTSEQQHATHFERQIAVRENTHD